MKVPKHGADSAGTLLFLRAEPIYVVGDSHVLIHADRLALNPENLASAFVFRSLYAPGLKAASFTDDRGELSEQMRSALLAAHLLVYNRDTLEAYHRTTDSHWLAVEGAGDCARIDPRIVFSIGALDVFDLCDSLPVDDFALPSRLCDRLAHRWGAVEEGEAPFEDVAEFFNAITPPLVAGLRKLRAYGFERLAILSIAPPIASDEIFRAIARMTGRSYPESRCRTALRYKCVYVMNALLRETAEANGATFVDLWESQTVDGMARPDLLHDSVHLTSVAWQETARAVVAALSGDLDPT